MKRIINRIKEFRARKKRERKRWLEVSKKKKLNVGSGGVEFDETWFSCDIGILNLTKKSDWKKLLKRTKVDRIFAEHVWEHLSEEDTRIANIHCYEFLSEGGRLRIAVPDGYHPNKEYINNVKPNGIGRGASDHKILYNYKILTSRLENVGFKVELLEYWDENGDFHFVDWSTDDGKVQRSRLFDPRNSDGQLNYTSLIVDAIK